MDDKSDIMNRSVGSRGQMRRTKTVEGTARTLRRPSSKVPKKKGGLDLGAKLNNLQSVQQQDGNGKQRLRRRSSNRELGTGDDNVSVVSRGVQSCAGSVGRRAARRSRATQSHDLLARNLQHYDKANNEDEEIIHNKRSSTSDVPTKAKGREEAWRSRRRRSVATNNSMPMPIAA